MKIMDIRIATQEDRREWNEAALDSPNATYAHTWEWKEVLEKGLGIESICIVAEENNKIIGIYPGFILPTKQKILSKYYQILSSPFDPTWDYGGPCILPNVDKNVLEKVLEYTENFAIETNVVTIKISPFEGDDLKKILISREYRVSPRDTSIIDLTKGEEELWRGIKKDARKYINKPKKEGVIVTEENNKEGLREFYKCMLDLKKRHPEMYLPSFSFFETILDIMVPNTLAKFHLVQHGSNVIGAGLSFAFKDTVTFRYGSGYTKYRDLYPHYILNWSRILESKELGYKKVDLGGMPSEKDRGIYFFKSRWGGEIKNVDWFIKDIRFEGIRRIKRKIKSIYYSFQR